MSLQILGGRTTGQGRDSDFAKRCLYVRASQLVEVEGGRKIHEFIQQILVDGLLCTMCLLETRKEKKTKPHGIFLHMGRNKRKDI